VDGLDLAQITTFELDLTAVTFADSSVLAWMLALRRQAEAAATALVVLVTPDGPCARLLEITGLDRRLFTVTNQPCRHEVGAVEKERRVRWTDVVRPRFARLTAADHRRRLRRRS